METACLKQDDDDSWTLEIIRESGLREVQLLGRLSKEQAQRTALERLRPEIKILCLDKDVMQAIKDGRLRKIVSV